MRHTTYNCVLTTIKDIKVAHRPIINGFQIDLQSDYKNQLLIFN